MVERMNKEEAARQYAAADKRIKGISSIAQSTINRSKVLEVEKQYGTLKGNKQAVSSVDRALKSLTKSTQALAMGVKLITVETARGVKNITQTGATVVGEYTKALGEDIHIKREGMMVALTAKITPLIGYAISKLFETTIFKTMIERMKSGLNAALASVTSRFKRLASAGWEKSKEFWNSLRDKTSSKRGSISVQVKNAKKNKSGRAGSKNKIESQVPHMAKGGYVKKEGLAKVHAAEVVQPVGKVVETIVEQVNKRVDAKEKKQKSFLEGTVFESSKGKKAKDLFGFEKVGSSIRNAFEIMTRSNLDLERQIMRRDKTEQRGLVRSFITAYSEEAKQEELPLMERQVQATIELKKTISGQNKVAEAAWNKMLYEHPVFHAIYGSSKWLIKTMGLPVKFLFKKRGIYANRLSKRGTIFERLLDAMTNTYTGLMGKMDNVIGNTYVSAAATAAASGKKPDGLTKAPKQSGYTIIGAAARLVGKGLSKAGKLGKWALRKTAFKDMDQEKWDKFDKFNPKKAAAKWKEDAKSKLKKTAISPFAYAYDNLKYRNKEDTAKWKDQKREAANNKKLKKAEAKVASKKWWGEFKEKNEAMAQEWKRRQNRKRRADNIAKKIQKEEDEWIAASRGQKRKTYQKGFRADSDTTKDHAKKLLKERTRQKYKNVEKSGFPFKYKMEKGDKDKTGKETLVKVFRDLRKIAKKNLKENTQQAKSQDKLTKFATGWRRFMPFIKAAFGGVMTVLTGFMGMVGTGLSLLLGAFGLKMGLGKLAVKVGSSVYKVAAKVGTLAAKGGTEAVKAGLKTGVGKKVAASGVGIAATAAAKKFAQNRAKQKAAEVIAKKAGAKAGIKGAAKIGGKIGSKVIPGLGILAGAYFASQRLLKGQFIEAGLELTSGIMGGTAMLSFGGSLVGMGAAEGALAYRDMQRAKGKYKKMSKKHKNLAADTVKKIQQIQMSTLDYLPVFAGFTGSATAMVTASYLNRYGVNNPDSLVKAANSIAGFSQKAWIAGGGNAAVHAGAVEISRAQGKIKKLWSKGKGIFLDKTSEIYKQTKGFRKKASGISESMKSKAEDAYEKAQKEAKKMVKKGKGIYKDKGIFGASTVIAGKEMFWDGKKYIEKKGGEFTDKAKELYGDRGKIFNKGKEKAKDLYSGFKQKAMDVSDKMPTLMSKLGENITSSFMKFGSFLSESIGDPKEHFANMRDKVFTGITKARDSLASIYSKIHDLVELTKTSLGMKINEFQKKQKAKSKTKKMFEWLTGGGDNWSLPTFTSPLAKISAQAGVGLQFDQDAKGAIFKGHKGETGIMGGPGISFITPDKVRQGLFGGLGIDPKKVAEMSAGADVMKMKQSGELKNSLSGMSDSLATSGQNTANMIKSTIDKSISIMSSNSSNVASGGGNDSSSRSIRRDPDVANILGGRIT